MTPEIVHFSEGLPGFEACRRYVVVTADAFEPFCSLQGQGQDAPAFIAIDPRRVSPDFQCDLESTDRARLHMADDDGPGSGPLLWLSIVTVSDSGATANLRAPIVINPQTMRGVQLMPAASEQPLAFGLASEGA